MLTLASAVNRVGALQDRAESLLSPRRARLALAAYGAGFAMLASVALAHQVPDNVGLLGTRVEGISASIAVLDRGGPPLLGAHTVYGAPGAVARTDYFPVGVTDDQGIYLYLPVLGHVIGEQNPHILMKWFFIGCFALLFVVYPLLVYEFMGSVLAAVLAPVLVLTSFTFLQDTDLYWIVGWCVLLGLPLVFAALVRPWGRWTMFLLLAAALVASFSTSIRIHAGLPIVIAALAVGLLRAPSWRSRAFLSVAILVVSFSIDVGLMNGVRIARDEIVGVPFRHEYPTEHPTWHNIYIGLGYLPNKYGISWNDQVSIDAVKRVDPHAGYLTARYEHILRHLVFRLLKRDPSFVLGTLWTKYGVCMDDAIHRFAWFWPLVLAAAALVGRRRSRIRWFVALSVPALVLTLIPPVVTVPYAQYETGWLATVGFLVLLTGLWIVASVPDTIRWLRTRPRLEWRSFGVSRLELAVAAAILALLPLATIPAIVHAREAQRHAASTS